MKRPFAPRFGVAVVVRDLLRVVPFGRALLALALRLRGISYLQLVPAFQ